MAKSKTWVAIRYSLPKAGRSSAYKRLFGYEWTERKSVEAAGSTRTQKRNARVVRASGPVAEAKLANPPFTETRTLLREYKRKIPSDLEGLPYSRLGNGVILVPPSHASKAMRILRSRGCVASLAGPVMSSQEQYQTSNAYFLGQWQFYLSALDGLLANAVGDAQAMMSLEAALRLSERFLEDVRSLPVASVPEDIEALSMKPEILEALNAYSSRSEAKASLLTSLRNDVEMQLNVLREQGQAVLAAL